MESKEKVPPLTSSDAGPSQPSTSSINRIRKRKVTDCQSKKTSVQPKHTKNPDDPTLTEEERKSVRKSIRCRQSRVRMAETLEKLKRENAELRKMNELIPQLRAEKEYLRSAVFWQAAQNKGLVKQIMDMHDSQFVLSGDEDSLTNYLWDESPLSCEVETEKMNLRMQ